MRTRYLLFAFVFIMAAAPIYAGTVYYVNGFSGNDSNPGTQLAPWKTIQKAANIMIAGDEVSVAAGNYPERVTITKSGNSGAIISYTATGTVECRGFTVKADYILVKGFKVTANQTGWKAGQGICVEGKYCTIENNHAYYCPRGGIILTSTSSNCIVRGNRCHRNGMVGVEVHGANNIVENNEVWGSVVYHTPTGLNNGDADGIRFFDSGHIFRGNYIHDIKYDDPENVGYDPHIDGFQTWADQYHVAGSNILFEKNLIVLPAYKTPRANGHGFILHNCSYITIRNNIVFTHEGTDTDGHQTGAPTHHVKIENNTFIGSLAFNRANSPFGILLENCSHSSVKNNIVYNQVNQAIRIEGTTSTGLEISNNCIYNENGSIPGGTQYPYDLWGLDPSFRDPAVRDYHLKAGSPCINSGMTRPEITDDFDSAPRPVGGAYDIGAYEFGNQSDTALSITVQPQSLTIQNGQTAILATIPELSVNGIRPLGQARWFGVDSKVSVGNQAIDSSTIYYVDATNGSDANDGLTLEKPWKTISKVNNSIFMPGNSILFKRGETWREQLIVPSSGSAGSPIVFGAYGEGAKPIINGSDIISTWTATGTTVWQAAATTRPYAVWFDGTLGQNKVSAAACTSARDWFWGSNVLYCYSTSDPDSAFTNPGIEASSRRTALINTIDYITLDNITFSKGGNADNGEISIGLRQAKNIVVQDCEILDSVNLGIDIFDPSGTTTGDTLIQRCTFRGTGLSKSASGAPSGIQTYTLPSGVTTTVQHCTFQDMDLYGEHHGHGIYHCSGHLIWRYNYHYGDRRSTDAGAGAAVRITGATSTAEVYYNIFSNDGGRRYWGILPDGGTNNFYNNIFFENNFGALVQGGTNSFKNNIFFGPTSARYFICDTTKAYSGDFNLFYGASEGWIWNGGAENATIASWRTASSQDAHSLNADPLLVSETDFHLQAGSPCINAGTDVGLTQDYDGNSLKDTPDIGAYESGPPTTTTPPEVTTIVPSAIQSTSVTGGGSVTSEGGASATGGGIVTADGGATVTGRGVCWGLTANPTTSGSLTHDGSGTGSYVSSLTGLSPNTTYHVRAYATNSSGTGYGNDIAFTTSQEMTLPSVMTSAVTSITSTGAKGGGSVTSEGGTTVTERGLCWGLTANPEISGSHTHDGSGTGSFVSSLTELSPNTTYHVQAYATNSSGTGYGSDVSFTTLAAPGKKLKAPVLKKPSNGAMRQPTVIKLSWSDKNVRPAEVGHKIRIKPNGGSYTYYTVGKNIQSYKPSRLLTNIKYYWNVLAVGDNVGIADSPWSNSGKDNVFTTKK